MLPKQLAQPPTLIEGGSNRLMRQRHSIAGHELTSDAQKSGHFQIGLISNKVTAAKRRKRSVADLSQLIKCSSIAEESATQSNSQGSLNKQQLNLLSPQTRPLTPTLEQSQELETMGVQIMVSLAAGDSQRALGTSSVISSSSSSSSSKHSENNDSIVHNYSRQKEQNQNIDSNVVVKPTFDAITPPPAPSEQQKSNNNYDICGQNEFSFTDHKHSSGHIEKVNANCNPIKQRLATEQHQLLSLGPRVDRSQSCTPGTPTIVVDWSPGADSAACDATKATSTTSSAKSTTIALGAQLSMVSAHLAASEGAVAAPAASGQLDRHLIAGTSDCGGPKDSNMQRKLSLGRKWTTANSESLGSGLGLFPNQVRKQSIMLLNTLTVRGSQTLRRLSMAAQHPLDTLLRRSRSHDARDQTDQSDQDLASNNNCQQQTADSSANSNQLNNSSSRRKRKRQAKTLDDYLMAVAGIDSSSSSSLSNSRSSLSLAGGQSDPELDDYDDEDTDADYDHEQLHLDAYYKSSEDITHRAHKHHRRSKSDDANELATPNHFDINAHSYSDSRKCHLTSLLQRERIRLPCLKVADHDTNSTIRRPDICITFDATDQNQLPDAKLNIGADHPMDTTDAQMLEETPPQANNMTDGLSQNLVNEPDKSQIITSIQTAESTWCNNVNLTQNTIHIVNSNKKVQPTSSAANGQNITPATLLIGNKRATLRRRGKRTSRWHAKRLRAETKAAKTVAIIIGGFISCWLPFFTAYLGRAVVCESPDCVPQAFLSLFIWLGYLNSAINPVIYGLVSADFRQAFKNIICRCSFRNPRKDDSMVVSALVDNIIKSIL